MVVYGDFNAKSNSWYANGNINIEGSKITILTSSFDFTNTVIIIIIIFISIVIICTTHYQLLLFFCLIFICLFIYLLLFILHSQRFLMLCAL